ncbi:TIGR03620 family F420-dependent LLM class oxidoreductase [Actinophytocola oryzae]|uniref:Putative F420-dependent oxidoreductase n=1 Tax=Actinophytocola oryzae TaxID=502181 RepID=A0A4R7W0N4_9PSEU|nr:TIGR03620 family F420-dependent LLM class oxidoreductase [Actinophytocola oryzae]TDV55087.1 putative F420-dependent oxidoreductase [Actinophytocola oryzae]
MFGRLGVWTWAFDENPWPVVRDAVTEIEELGYGTVWFGEGAGRDAPTQAGLLLSATSRLVVAPGIANIYRRPAAAMAQAERTLSEAYPGRFVLGLGVGAKAMTGDRWRPPIGAMTDYLTAMDEARLTGPAPAAPPRRVLAALGPRMLRLAADRTAGAHPYLLPVEHTAYARELMGPDAVLAVHQSVVLEPDRTRARELARSSVAGWLAHSDMVPSRWRMVREVTGFTDEDRDGGGSDRLVDAMVAAGDVDTIARRVADQFAAGANHVCLGVATGSPTPALGLRELRELAGISAV